MFFPRQELDWALCTEERMRERGRGRDRERDRERETITENVRDFKMSEKRKVGRQN